MGIALLHANQAAIRRWLIGEFSFGSYKRWKEKSSEHHMQIFPNLYEIIKKINYQRW
jgi:hypothetical protein